MSETCPSNGVPAVSSRARLLVFIVIVLSSGWIGVLVNRLLGIPDSMDSAGAAIWIATPLLAGIVMGLTDPSLRRSYIASWKPGRLRAYGVALVVFPLSFAAAIAVGWPAGWLDPSGLGAFTGVMVAAAAGTLGKNVFEEGAWRGYLAPALRGRGLPDPWVWVISGTVWAVWHYPYYLFLFDESLTRAVWDVPPVVYATLGIVIMNLWAPLFTELRLLSGSFWPGVIAHSVANLSQLPLTMGGLPIAPGKYLIVSPMVGMIPNAVVLGAGLLLWARRTGRLRRGR
ncbi:CPBP family intramembrane glutamic endopeptidase [Actinomyces massiliensis]|uniref:CPBP family intramembrane glutamic endopeptidase n=1 Tax=Actinomyces massiliensis TaxID=461393 RepID=UPI0028E5AD0A|nr:CPBP family intramembrane glutamic endopeptidase [Actinomyces massiliensis]